MKPQATNRLISGLKPDISHSMEIPSKRLLGALPIKRFIPQDVHSVMDYANGALALSGAFMSDCAEAKVASIVLGTSDIGVSLMTDYKLSAVKIVPIEVHEVIDYVWGATAIAAPFVLGYWKKDPVTAASHILCGVGNIVASLFTDYRAARGVGRRLRSGASRDVDVDIDIVGTEVEGVTTTGL